MLVIEVPFITSDMTNADVLHILGEHRDLISLPVLENNRPIGLISRNIFMSQMSKPYYRELYEKKSCIAFMDKSPLIADVQTPIETLAAQAVESGNKTLADGFIIVDGSRFVGVGSGLDLMHLLVDLQTEKNRQVMQSIDYASAIQKGMLGESLKSLQSTLSDAAIIWEPRDVVGGDFYHFQAFPNGWFAAIADCTGHGVPGAFLTLIASSSLRHALDRHGPENPAFLLAEVSLGIKLALGQHDTQAQTGLFNDGADAVFMWFDANQNTLTSAHAKMALFILPEGSENLITLNGERLGLGYTDTPARAVWKNHTTELTANTLVLACTDGLIDQIGGAKHIAFGKRRVRQALLQHRTLSAPALLESLMATLSQYQGTQARRDDLTLFGFRPNPN
ncbi:MAG: protein-serine/threonine phosphatase [Pusillimonas sp.]|nr:protein-serine/threonine phosphatase [Pusillimonas sp.]MBC41341.1 protein-serine/threonine phosphatase [Pusillimonas sp.]|tara:strand:+ start:27975 stop:29153 length:1179 start_codon:yes stop_codon:yes gene_type:complete